MTTKEHIEDLLKHAQGLLEKANTPRSKAYLEGLVKGYENTLIYL